MIAVLKDRKLIDIMQGREVTAMNSEGVWIDGRKVISRPGQGVTALAIPDQDVSHLYQEGPGGRTLVGSLADLILYSLEEQAQLIDRDTGRAIDEAAHPFAGIEEQIGILREQIGEILNALGLAPTVDFDRLNNIATEKIQERQKKKEAL